MELAVLGVSATVDAAGATVPKNTASGVRILFRGGTGDLAPADISRFLGGAYTIEGDFSGPGLAETVTLSSPGSSTTAPILRLPPVAIAGDYTLANVRLVVNGRTVLDATPRTTLIKVIDQILITSVKTRPLTLAEIKAKGIVLDSDDYLGFEFTLGLKFMSKPVNITFPVVFDRDGVAVPQRFGGGFGFPSVDPDMPNLPEMLPIMMKLARPLGMKSTETLPAIRIPSLIVIPGRVGYLKQFFSAQLFVGNGAPGGTGLVVRDITGTIKLPKGQDLAPGTADDPLALPTTTEGQQPATVGVRAPGPDGAPGTSDDVGVLNAGESGQAEFLIRGEKEGFHTIDFDIAGTLDGLPVGPVAVTGSATGGVLVRNPYFNITFTVPNVVRKFEPFKLYATVTNIGKALANAVSIELDSSRMSGAEVIGNATRAIETLVPGEARTLVFDFRSLRTGQVSATYLHLETTDGSTGALRFTLGVDERGVALSPDTLVLPGPIDALPGSLVDAAMRVLGQAWSLAGADSETLPAGILRTSHAAVQEKAIALAEAGLRIVLGQPPGDAIKDLAFDFYGQPFVDRWQRPPATPLDLWSHVALLFTEKKIPVCFE